MPIRWLLFWCGLGCGLVSGGLRAGEPASYAAGRRDFEERMVQAHGFAREELRQMLAQARYRPEILEAIQRPWEAKPWPAYRALFVTEERVAGGVDFLHAHRETLARAAREYGVPPEILVAILGVETNYGTTMGRHGVLDALATLAFCYPKRADFFARELEEWLLLGREEPLVWSNLTGSYAGAMGMAQFIPSSYRRYALDFDGDGRRDLWHSPADAIGSIAHYLSRHGWQPGRPVAERVLLSRPWPANLRVAEKNPENPTLGTEILTSIGISPPAGSGENERFSLLRLEAPQEEFWLGTMNFYVITRYNRSNLYAMAVFQLSREIRESSLAEG